MSPPAPTRATLLEVVDDARRAPSMYNAQPWAWRVEHDAGVLELHADRRRRIPVADPDGRHLVLGCGAALHHARVAAEARGLVVVTHLLPDPDRPDLLARLVLAPGDPDADPRQLAALRARRTDRRSFSSWPVPPERVERLAAAAAAEGATAVALRDERSRHRAERLVAQALRLSAADPGLQEELRGWLDRATDGVARGSVPRLVPRDAGYRSRFGPGHLSHPDRDPRGPEGRDGLLVLAGPDGPAGWLRSGMGLSAAWLLAEATGLSVVPLSQVVEVTATRSALAADLAADLARAGDPSDSPVPHLLLRVGWLDPDRDRLAPTARRPLSEVLLP